MAFHLKLPIYELSDKMSYEELLGWIDYFDRRPIGWRNDLSTAYLLNALGDSRAPTKIFKSLENISKDGTKNTMGSKLNNSALLQKMLSAKNGKQLPLD